MLTKCAAMELGPYGVRVSGIGPGFVDTPLTAFTQMVPAIRDAYVAVDPARPRRPARRHRRRRAVPRERRGPVGERRHPVRRRRVDAQGLPRAPQDRRRLTDLRRRRRERRGSATHVTPITGPRARKSRIRRFTSAGLLEVEEVAGRRRRSARRSPRGAARRATARSATSTPMQPSSSPWRYSVGTGIGPVPAALTSAERRDRAASCRAWRGSSRSRPRWTRATPSVSLSAAHERGVGRVAGRPVRSTGSR